MYNPLILCETCKTNTRHTLVEQTYHGDIYRCLRCNTRRIYGGIRPIKEITNAKKTSSDVIRSHDVSI